MQQKKSDIDAFLERTDRLAERLGISLRDLGPRMGISQATLFGCRAGKIPLSPKTWRKLEQLEHDAGLLSQETYEVGRQGYMVRESLTVAGEAANLVEGTPAERQKAFEQFLGEIRALRAEAQDAAHGDKEKEIDLFDAFLAAWTARQAAFPHRPLAEPKAHSVPAPPQPQ